VSIRLQVLKDEIRCFHRRIYLRLVMVMQKGPTW
jgi:hypothetical protein